MTMVNILKTHSLPGYKRTHSRESRSPWQSESRCGTFQALCEHEQINECCDTLSPQAASVGDITEWATSPNFFKRRLHLWEMNQAGLNSTLMDLRYRCTHAEAPWVFILILTIHSTFSITCLT